VHDELLDVQHVEAVLDGEVNGLLRGDQQILHVGEGGLAERPLPGHALADLDVVDRWPMPPHLARGGIDVRRGRHHQALNALRCARRHLDRDDAAGVMAGQGRTLEAKGVEDLHHGGGVVLDAVLGDRRRGAEADRVHGDGPVRPAEQGEHLAVLVPGPRRLVQEHDGGAGAALCVVDLPEGGVGVALPNLRHAASPWRTSARKARLIGL
jgi:hypothetical protein